jgi:hypothetical protein
MSSVEKTTLYLPGGLHRELQMAARRSGRPQAELVRVALQEYLDRMRRPKLSSIGAGEDPELAGKDTEQWLEREWAAR